MPDEYGHPDIRAGRGDVLLIGGLADYLESEAPDEQYVNWLIYLPKHVVDAFVAFRSLSRWSVLRTVYLSETGSEIPDLTDGRGGSERSMVVYSLKRLLPLLTESPWLATELAYLDAEMMVINQAWRRFVRLAYAPTMARIKAEAQRGSSGTFGVTRLTTYALAGRVTFTFERGESSMTYVADDGDAHGHRSGANWPTAAYAECVEMLDDVTAHWDLARLVATE